MSDQSLGNFWDYASWKDIEASVFAMQKRIVLVVLRRDDYARIQAQKNLVCSVDAKMLTVKHISDTMNALGIDGVRWFTSTEKMKAVLSLASRGYAAKPMKMFIIQ
jgi:hypothetical protein